MADARGPTPSPWISQWARLVSAEATVLDVAAGSGRHAIFFAERGHEVVALDRDIGRLPPHPRIAPMQADLEAGAPWPLGDRNFGAVVVANYLHRPLMADLLAAVAPGGLLIYETFMEGNEHLGRPRRPEFLLRDGELLDLIRGRFSVIAYEALLIDHPRPAMVQQIVARRR